MIVLTIDELIYHPKSRIIQRNCLRDMHKNIFYSCRVKLWLHTVTLIQLQDLYKSLSHVKIIDFHRANFIRAILIFLKRILNILFRTHSSIHYLVLKVQSESFNPLTISFHFYSIGFSTTGFTIIPESTVMSTGIWWR